MSFSSPSFPLTTAATSDTGEPCEWYVHAPYIRCIDVNVKQRWRGRSVTHVLASDFGFPEDYSRNALECGTLQVYFEGSSRSRVVDPSCLQNGDKIRHIFCFHEAPLPRLWPRLVCREGGVLAVVKPVGWLTTPASQTYLTSLVEHCRHLSPTGFLQPLNRLDRCVSGLVVCATDRESSKRLGSLVLRKGGDVRKVYVAMCSRAIGGDEEESTNEADTRVREKTYDHKNGHFCEKTRDDTDLQFCEKNTYESDWQLCEDAQIIDISLPLRTLTERVPLQACVDLHQGAECRTLVKEIARRRRRVDGGSKEQILLLCRPITGRSHQIRVHLASGPLRAPIVGDCLYGGEPLPKEIRSQLWREEEAHMKASAKRKLSFHEEKCDLSENHGRKMRGLDGVCMEPQQYGVTENYRIDVCLDLEENVAKDASMGSYIDPQSVARPTRIDPLLEEAARRLCKICSNKKKNDLHEEPNTLGGRGDRDGSGVSAETDDDSDTKNAAEKIRNDISAPAAAKRENGPTLEAICLHSLFYEIEERQFFGGFPSWMPIKNEDKLFPLLKQFLRESDELLIV